MAELAMSSAVFRKCGVPDWILVDDDWKGFVGYFKDNITETNIFTDEELVEQDRLRRDKNDITITVKERMDKINNKYNGIWSASEDDIDDLEQRIEIVNHEKELYEDLVAKTKGVNLRVIGDLTDLKSKSTKLLSEEPTLGDECLRRMEELQDAKFSNERKINELGLLYSKPVQNPLFMHQMPLSDYFRQLEQFNTNAKHFMQKNFKIQSAESETHPEKSKQNENVQLLSKLSVVADRLLNAYNKMYLAETNLSAKTALTNQFKAQNWSPSTLMSMRRDMQQMERDIELNEAQKQHLMHKLQELVIQTSQLDVEAMVYESNQKRMGRAKQRMMYINRFASVISETMTISEKLWILMQLDMERMKNRSKFDSKLDAYRLELLACNRRIEIMNAIGKLNNDAVINSYCDAIVDLLQVNVPEYRGNGIERIIKCILSVDEFKSKVSQQVESLKTKPSSIWIEYEFFKKASHTEDILRKFLFDGPVAKPQQYTDWYRKKKTSLERELKAIKELNELKKEECSGYIKKWSNDKYYRQKQVLWVWFLTEPKKVIKALKSISSEVQLRSITVGTAPRAIAGIVRRN